MPWNSLKDLAQQRLTDKGLHTKVQDALVLDQANEIIRNFFGAEAFEKARAIYFSEGILTMAILSQSLRNELESQQVEFLAILNDKFSEKIVYNLRFLG
ncbi:MAG: hypothetical protein C3F02_03940 [Parcubacteria group bacterium]|nr:MAG: hypothetical protein C3F02_03940 [Parcubacteria group bacterium]